MNRETLDMLAKHNPELRKALFWEDLPVVVHYLAKIVLYLLSVVALVKFVFFL